MSRYKSKLNERIDYASYWLVVRLMMILALGLALLSLSLIVIALNSLVSGNMTMLIVGMASLPMLFLAQGFRQVSEHLVRWDPDVEYERDEDGWIIGTRLK